MVVHVCFKDAAIMIVIILKTSFKPEVSSSYVVMDKTKKELSGNSKGILIFSKLCLVSFLVNIVRTSCVHWFSHQSATGRQLICLLCRFYSIETHSDKQALNIQ